MRNIRSYADIEAARAADKLTPAEEKLIECSQSGKLCTLGDGARPSAPSPERQVGADLLRYLILGGCDECTVHDLGVRLKGAYVPDRLDMSFAQAKGVTSLLNCHFDKILLARGCRINTLTLHGSRLTQGLKAQRAKVSGSVFLRNGFTALGTVDFVGAKIGGQLSVAGGRFEPSKGDALNLQKAHAESLIWRQIKSVKGDVKLSGAHFDDILDDDASWKKTDNLVLIGLSYDHLVNPRDVETRLAWLGKGDRINGEFSPQPYTQLAKVLRAMGHDRDARLVLYEKEKRLAEAEQQRSRDRITALKTSLTTEDEDHLPQATLQSRQSELSKLREEHLLAKVWSHLLRILVGYGYKPRLILYWTSGIILAMSLLSSLTYNLGGMVPNSPIVLLSDEWGAAVTAFNPAEAWVATPAGQHYETFSSLAYAADVFIPLVPLGQEDAWTPTTQTSLGKALWMLNWFVKLSGWFITALGAAAITGIIRRE